MAVPMHAYSPYLTGTFKAVLHTVQRLLVHTAVGRSEIGRNKAMFQQIVAWLYTEAAAIESRALAKWPHGAACVHAPEETSDSFKCVAIFQFRRAAAMFWKDSERSEERRVGKGRGTMW